MTGAVLTALLSHWRRNPIQLFAFLAGLALATALWCGVQAINAEARASYDAAASTLGEGQYDQLLPKDGRGIPLELYVKLRRSGWLVSPVFDERLDGVRLVGIDPLTAPAGIGALQDLNSGPALGLMDQGTLLGTAETAQALAGVASVSVDANMAPGVAIGDISAVQTLLGRNDFNRLILLPVQPIDQPDLAVVAPELHVQAAQQGADLGQLTDSFHLNLTAFGMLSFAVGLFIVHSTIGLAFEQRRGMIRTLRSLGVPLRLVVTLITVEMLTLALIGAGLGVVFGYMVAAVLLPDVAATLRGLYGADISGTLQLRTQWWLSGLLIAMLGAGAYFVILGEMSAGAMIAASVLLGRALAPVEQVMAGWPTFQKARSGWDSLSRFLGATGEERKWMNLPQPESRLDVQEITVIAPGTTVVALTGITFQIKPGQVLGVIGPSGSGKTALARTLVGYWPVADGQVRLGDAQLDHYDPEQLGRLIGYLPQNVTLFPGTIAENIARMALDPESDAVVKAAMRANAHELIMSLPEGYSTYLDGADTLLSGGQRQRIALARALFGNPVLLVLDEPNSMLDAEGAAALNRAVREFREIGLSVVIMTHRPEALAECDTLMVIANGQMKTYGPRGDIGANTVREATKASPSQARGARS